MNEPVWFDDQSTECAICLGDLNESETIALSCGHLWHLRCLENQLRHAQPDCSRRLLFNGCRCAKCGAFCNHPALQNLTRTTDRLRKRVDVLVQEQLDIDRPSEWTASHSDPVSRCKLVERARRTYAFYLCSACKEPYFGGTVECADETEGEKAPDDRLCPSCIPQIQHRCRHPELHRGFHLWKCRYCCRPASHVCYGTVHFCDDCHQRNTRRVQQPHRHEQTGRPSLQPLPCPGKHRCPYPMPAGRISHSNGPAADCEQVYRCGRCASNPNETAATHEHPGSRNLIQNPNGENGIRYWQRVTNGHRLLTMWNTEQSEIPATADSRTNFVSNFRWCAMQQHISLHRILLRPTPVQIEVSCKYMSRTDCPAIFVLKAQTFDRLGRVLSRYSTPALDAPPGYWEKASLVVEAGEDVHEVAMIVFGKDKRFWQGNFGSKVADCSLRILGSPEELERLMHPDRQENTGENLERNMPVDTSEQSLLNYSMIGPLIFLLVAWLVLQV